MVSRRSTTQDDPKTQNQSGKTQTESSQELIFDYEQMEIESAEHHRRTWTEEDAEHGRKVMKRIRRELGEDDD